MSQRICSIEDCGRRHYAKGMCRRHYDPAIRKGWRSSPHRVCSVDGCDSPHNARDLCSTHYKRWQASIKPPCSVVDCGRPAVKREWCAGHYNRWRKHGDPEAGPPVKDRAPNGSPRPVATSGGYVLVWAPNHPNAQANGYVLEHVKVMADDLERPLVKGENVHHLNGNRADNRRENLELWVSMQPTGQRPPDLIRYALEILARYGGDPADSHRSGGAL